MRRSVLLPIVLATCLLAGCAGSSAAGPSAPVSSGATAHTAAPGPTSYVALGDSYTAAPYVNLTDVALGCFRSDHDYPHLLATSLPAKPFRDVSCSGATIHDLTHASTTLAGQRVPAQVRALRTTTSLVTIGIGGNEDGLFATLAGGCPITFGGGPGTARTATCGPIDTAVADRAIADVGPRLTAALAVVRRRAPHARIVVVGYPRIASTTTTCPKLLPITHETAVVVDRVIRRLDATLRTAARRAGASYVDMYAASAGHDVCSASPWVNGIHTDTARAAALHPFLAEQQAVAGLVKRAVGR